LGKNSIENYLDVEGRVKNWPSKLKNKYLVLDYLITKFQYNIDYTENEVNQIINQYHTFNDYAIIRRSLCDSGYLKRTIDGGKYWRERVNTDDSYLSKA
jgi:hypothetical protein